MDKCSCPSEPNSVIDLIITLSSTMERINCRRFKHFILTQVSSISVYSPAQHSISMPRYKDEKTQAQCLHTDQAQQPSPEVTAITPAHLQIASRKIFPARPSIASASFALGNGSLGTGHPRISHNGTHPSLSSIIWNFAGGVTFLTYWLCSSILPDNMLQPFISFNVGFWQDLRSVIGPQFSSCLPQTISAKSLLEMLSMRLHLLLQKL